MRRTGQRRSGQTAGEIGSGSLVLVCAMQGDGEKESEWLPRKVVNLRNLPRRGRPHEPLARLAVLFDLANSANRPS
jgi:hypothetical protein